MFFFVSKLSKCSLWLMLAGLAIALTAPSARCAEYPVQPEDVLSIRVSGEPGLSQNYTVDEHGDISLDTVGKVHVQGETAKQIQEKLTKELGRFLKVFEVAVNVVGEVGNRVLVFGEVSKPGSVKLRPGGKLLDALAEAGQPTLNADTKRISVSHREGSKAQEIDLEAALKTPALNVELTPGDTVTVPSKAVRSVRVDGEVRNPGPRSIDETKTAYAAVMAAGPSASADWKRIALRRKNSSIPLIIDLSPVRTGQLKDDLELQEGDQLTVMAKFSGTATLRGEVKTPGEKDLNGSTQLWDFILNLGGGFTEKADRMRIQISRPGKAVRTVNLLAVASGARRSDDPELEVQGGDIIFVPTGTAWLVGEVKNTGERPLGTSTTIQDFIATAGGGFTDKADHSHVQLKRDGKVVKVIDLAEIASGTKSSEQDVEIQPGDTIFVPNDDKNRFAIVGGVKKPGTYAVKPGMTLLDAVAVADGFTDKASHKQFVLAPASLYGPDGKLKSAAVNPHAKKDDPSRYGLVVIDYKQLLKGDPTQNVAINPGDRILIPEEIVNPNQRKKPSFLQSIMQMVPLASMFMGGYGYGYGGYGYGGY